MTASASIGSLAAAFTVFGARVSIRRSSSCLLRWFKFQNAGAACDSAEATLGASPLHDAGKHCRHRQWLAYQMLQFLFNVFPLFGLRQRGNGLGDRRPFARQLDVELDEMLLVGRDIFFGIDCIDRA